MRRLSVFVLVMMLIVGGCTKRAGLTGIGVGVGVAVIGGMVAASGEGRTAMGNAYLGGSIAGVGGAIVVAALAGMILRSAAGPMVEETDETVDDEDDQAAQALDLRRERAWEITKQAEADARAGDCASVVARDIEVRMLNSEFHTKVFLSDVGIKHCLATAGADDSAAR